MHNIIFTVILLLLSASLKAGTEDLTDLSIEELLKVEVISASRLGQKASQAPSSISVVNASDIRTFGWRTLADALNSMRGLFTSNNRNYSFLGVRGFIQPDDYNSRVLLMIDGQRMNENIYDGGYNAQEYMLDMDLVERIEFIPGTGSSIYGANAFLGLINVVTKKGKTVDGAQLSAEIGDFDTYKGRISYGKKLANGADLLFSASHFDSAGVENLYFPAHDNPASNNGIAHNMDTERADRLFGKIQYAEFTLSGGVVDRYKRVPTAAFSEIFNNPQNYTNDLQFFGNLRYNTELNEKTALMIKGFYQGYDYHAESSYDVGTDARTLINHDQVSGRWLGGEMQLTTHAFDRQRWIVGLEYQYDLRQNDLNYDIDPYALLLNSNRSGYRVEWYAQDDIQLLDTLIFSAGLRFDYHHMISNLPLNPRLGLIWNPVASTTVKLLYSSTFRAPNVAELDYNPYYFSVNTALGEERIKSYESIVEWRPANGLQVFGSFFFNDISQLLGVNPDHPDDGLLENAGKYHVYGTEWEAEKRWNNGRLLKASYTYSLMANEAKQEAREIGSPEHLFKLHYAEPLFHNYARLGIENIFIGDRKTAQGGFAEAYDLININLTSDRIVQGLNLSLGVYNLLDNHYPIPGGGVNNILLMNGRDYRLKLQIAF